MLDPNLLLLFTALGIVAGIVIGLMPGLGVSSAFLLIAPFLVAVNPIYSLFFFIALLAVSQYFGSITALVFGVPGELSSFPVIRERANILDQIDNVLKQTAVGSFIGALAALVLFLVLLNAGSLWIYLYNYRVFSWVLVLAAAAIVFYGSQANKITTNAVLFFIGIVLSRVGYDHQFGQLWGTWGIENLYTGIPLAAVAVGLLVIPSLLQTVQRVNTVLPVQQTVAKITHWASMARGTVFGIIGGLVPGVTYMASTQLSYFVENVINKRSQQRPTQSVVATSTADNAGATSSLYPLLWLGIPISLGEAMLTWLFDKNNQVLNLTTLSQPVGDYPLYWYLLGCFLLANIAAYLLSWPGRKISVAIAQSLLNRAASYCIILLVVAGVYFLAQESYNITTFYISLLLSCATALIVRRVDWMPLIMGMILGDTIVLTLFKLGVISL